MKIIYSIKVDYIDTGGKYFLKVKIGKTTNIKSIISTYKRSHMTVEILDLWKSNKELSLSQCEKGVLKLAEIYAYKKESEKYLFSKNGYDDFSNHTSLFLNKISLEETEQNKKKTGISETINMDYIINLIKKAGFIPNIINENEIKFGTIKDKTFVYIRKTKNGYAWREYVPESKYKQPWETTTKLFTVDDFRKKFFEKYNMKK